MLNDGEKIIILYLNKLQKKKIDIIMINYLLEQFQLKVNIFLLKMKTVSQDKELI